MKDKAIKIETVTEFDDFLTEIVEEEKKACKTVQKTIALMNKKLSNKKDGNNGIKQSRH